MQPPELYILCPRGISAEELARMNAEAARSDEVLQREQQKFTDLQKQLPAVIKDAVQAKRSLSQRKPKRSFLHRLFGS